ncbi:rod shape-determining protein MreD [Clostridium bornimense]|uniref:rod shape-determining protein MreD n=2 Tax=Clostridium TaxID=1485 RepID=UPI001C113C92|nr:rod shape-determining protein MreD [Clostridium bornimense]MBU5317228.1 rod shape-determining protein MreD [Clostridium bornimense]
MKRILTLLLLLIGLFILDNSVVPLFSIGGYCPSLILVFILGYSMLIDPIDAIFLGIASGLIQDVYFHGVLGVNGFLNMGACVICSVIGTKIFREKRLFPVIITFFLSALKYSIVFIVMYSLGEKYNYLNIIFGSLYNMIIAIIAYGWIYNLSQKSFMVRDWEF